jgi:Bacterial regulatory helix-turn-helix protein, lysR family/Isocitrate lyase family
MLDFELLRAFVAVADCGGFHRAAERFNLTQSTVSQQIKRLDLETERLLFRRKVLLPIAQHIRTLNAARLAADVEGVSTILLCRTDAYSAQLLTSDIDERDRPFLSGERTREGFFPPQAGAWARLRNRPQPRLCTLCGSAVVGDERARSRRGGAICRSNPSPIPGQNARLQLLAELQLAAGIGTQEDRRFSA